jgi:arabinogalactan oligomer/maltooligosaccharide transport system substrate-binding protein
VKQAYKTVFILIALSLALSACGKKPTPTPVPALPPKAPTQPATAAVPTRTPEPTRTPRPTETPTPAPTPEPAWKCPEGNPPITLWHAWSDRELPGIRQIFNEYQETCPNVRLDLVSRSDLADVTPDIIRADDGPDIFTVLNKDIGRLAEGQALVPLDSYIDGDKFARSYVGVAASGVRYKGQLFAYPESMEVITMIYNRDLIGADELPKDTDDLLKRAAEWKKTDYFLVYAARNDAYFSAPWWQAAGVTIMDDEGNTTFKSNAGYTAGNFIDALRQIMPGRIDYNLADTLFKGAKAPITINGPWYIADLEAAGINYGLAPLPVFSPTGTPAMPLVSVRGLALTPVAVQRGVAAAAVNAMQYYTRAEAQIVLARANGMIPAHRAAVAAPEVEALSVVAVFSAQAALGKPLPTSPFMSAMWDPIARGVECIWTGAASIRQCVDNIIPLR